MLGETGLQVLRNSRIDVSFGRHVFQHVNIIKSGHGKDPFRCCGLGPASSADADYAAAVFPWPGSLGVASGLPRRNLGVAEMKTGGGYLRSSN